jgi:hypothetical protein
MSSAREEGTMKKEWRKEEVPAWFARLHFLPIKMFSSCDFIPG